MADLTKEEIKNIIKEIKEDKELKKAFDTALGRDDSLKRSDDVGELKDQLKLEEDRARILKETAKSMNQISEFRKQEAKELQLKTELELVTLKNLDEIKEDEKKILDTIIEQVRAGKELKETTGFNNIETGALRDSVEALKNKYNEIVPEQEKLNDLSRETKSNIEDTVESMGGLVGLSNKLNTSKIGKMTQMFKTLKGEEGDEAAKFLSDQLSEMFSIQNIAMNIFDGIFDQSMKVLTAFDNASATLAKTT